MTTKLPGIATQDFYLVRPADGTEILVLKGQELLILPAHPESPVTTVEIPGERLRGRVNVRWVRATA